MLFCTGLYFCLLSLCVREAESRHNGCESRKFPLLTLVLQSGPIPCNCNSRGSGKGGFSGDSCQPLTVCFSSLLTLVCRNKIGALTGGTADFPTGFGLKPWYTPHTRLPAKFRISCQLQHLHRELHVIYSAVSPESAVVAHHFQLQLYLR